MEPLGIAEPEDAGKDYEIRVSTVIAGALTLTAALAWNEAAKAGIGALYSNPNQSTFQATLIYAILVTIIIVVVMGALRVTAEATASAVAEAKKKNGGSFIPGRGGGRPGPGRPGPRRP